VVVGYTGSLLEVVQQGEHEQIVAIVGELLRGVCCGTFAAGLRVTIANKMDSVAPV